MLLQSRTSGVRAGLLSVLALAALPAGALGAPATVDLRIEGKTRTLYEGSVTTDVRTFRFTTSPTEYQCDGTGSNGASTVPVPTRGAAVTAASLSTPFSTSGSFSSFGPTFSEIAGESTAFNPDTNEFLAEYKNDKFSDFGSCGDPIVTGDDVLFAYGDGSEPLLGLAGPATAKPGDTVELAVEDQRDDRPVAGAAVGGQTSDTAGRARVVVTQRGDNVFKATKSGAIRSNAARVCVTDGQDGFCGTRRPDGSTATPGPSTTPGSSPAATTAPTQATPAARDTSRPVGRVAGLRTGQRFTVANAPRELRFTATDASGIAQVKLRLTRRAKGRCAYLSGRKERFVPVRCGRSFAFKASDRGDFSYLLPERLTPGRYVLDVVAIDRAGNRDELARGRSRIVFTVR